MPRWKRTELSQADQFRKKREAVLREAGRAFAKNGFHDTSLDDVARALDVTKAALYTYVKTKQEILFECHKASMDLGEADFASAVAKGGNAAEIIESFLFSYIGDLTSENGAFAILSELNALTPEDRKVIADRRDAFERKLVNLIKKGIKEGSIDSVDPKIAIFSLMGAIHWVARWFDPAGRLPSDEVARRLSSVLMRGIAANPRG